MKALVTCLLGGVLFAAMQPAMARCDSGEKVIRFSHDVDTDRHPKGVAATQLAERVNRQLDGVACMRVYPFSSLAKASDVVDAVIKGEVEMAAPALSRFTKYAGGFRVFQMPFMFRNLEAVQTFQRSDTGLKLKQSMVSAGIQGLTYWHGGMRQMAALESITLPGQIGGKRIGTANGGANLRQLEIAGFVPVVTPTKGLIGVASAGRVQVVEATWADLFRHRIYKALPYVTQTNHGVDGYLLMTSTKFWTDLKPETRDALWDLVWSLSEERNQVVLDQESVNLERMRNAGVPVTSLDDAKRGEWVRRFEPTWTDRIN